MAGAKLEISMYFAPMSLRFLASPTIRGKPISDVTLTPTGICTALITSVTIFSTRSKCSPTRGPPMHRGYFLSKYQSTAPSTDVVWPQPKFTSSKSIPSSSAFFAEATALSGKSPRGELHAIIGTPSGSLFFTISSVFVIRSQALRRTSPDTTVVIPKNSKPSAP